MREQSRRNRMLAVVTVLVVGMWPVGGRAWAEASGHNAPLPTVYRVDSKADSHDAHPGNGRCSDSLGRCTLRAAVEAANTDPAGLMVTIEVPGGTYALSLGSLEISGGPTLIVGTGPARSIIKAAGSFRVIHLSSSANASLVHLEVTAGRAGQGYGGGILSSGQLEVDDSFIAFNRGSAGGGIDNSGGQLTVVNSTVKSNVAPTYGGGGIQNGGIPNLPGTVEVLDSLVADNSSGGDGGGILNGQNGHPATAGTEFTAVRRWCAPAGRCNVSAAVSPVAGTSSTRVDLLVVSSRVDDNVSTNTGGGVSNDGGSAVIDGTAITRNLAPGTQGGGITSYGPLTVDNSTITYNQTTGCPTFGGGIWLFFGQVPGVPVIERSTIDDNSSCIGGGIEDDTSRLRVSASTIAYNGAQAGAGINLEAGGLSVINSTFVGNVALLKGAGGAIESDTCSTRSYFDSVSYSTIAGNSTGLALYSCSNLVLTGTIVASSVLGPNCLVFRPLESVGYNIDSGRSCHLSQSTDQSATDPRLGPLVANGGPTMTELPLPGSPAIGHGGSHGTGCPVTDQRGRPRPSARCDVGAVQVDGPSGTQ
jgi:hypothetical protein